MGSSKFGYFEYVIQKSAKNGISKVCSIMSTKDQLIKSLNDYLSMERCELDDLDYTLALLDELRLTANRPMEDDARLLLSKCQDALTRHKKAILRKEPICYQDLFDTSVDVSWWLASIQCQPGRNGKTGLMTKPGIIPTQIRKYLAQCYEIGIKSIVQCKYIEEAISAKEAYYPLRKYEFKYEQGQQYAKRWSKEDLSKSWSEHWSVYDHNMALFYGLTVTCMLAEEIRRKYL